MSVDTPSPDYEGMIVRWQRCRDCYDGEDSVKERGTTYLPALAGHDPSKSADPYWDYVGRALFYGAFGRAVDGLVGMVFRRPPVIDVPDAADELLENVDMEGRSLVDFAQVAMAEGLIMGRRGILVDHTSQLVEEEDAEGQVVASRTTPGRPYFTLYEAENILDTLYETSFDGVRKLVRVRLREIVEKPDPQDEFATQAEIRVRVLELDEGGQYQQRLFVLETTTASDGKTVKSEYVERASVAPTVDGGRLDYIPFWPLGTGAGRVMGEVEVPPLLDLANVNISHYRTSADIENAAHVAGVPTPVITGVPTDTKEILVGTSEAILLADAASQAFYLSYGGDGLAALENRLTSKEQMMAFLGARMLQPDKKAVETAETSRIHRMGEISVLGTMANHQSRAMTAALQLLLEWAGIKATTAEITLNNDYVPIKIEANMIAEMRATWQANGISYETFWSQLQEGEVAPANRTAEEELEKIDEERKARPAETMPLGGPAFGDKQAQLEVFKQRSAQAQDAAGTDQMPAKQDRAA